MALPWFEGAAMDLLLVDDEISLRRTLRITLESMGHGVAEASNSEQAREQIRQQSFDLAFLDLRLGREQGLDLLPRCAKTHRTWAWWW